jgi:HD-like signal output (HDOD) protein
MNNLETLLASNAEDTSSHRSQPDVETPPLDSVTRILFVDDQQELLGGLRRLFRPFQMEWEVRFAACADEALQILETWSAHVVVSDMRMPGMDGAQLLDEVRHRYPAAVRIMLSGQSDEEGILRSIAPVHQYLSKPCPPEHLKAVIRRVCAFRDRLADPVLAEFVSNLTSLPSVPRIYTQMQEELRSPESTVSNVAELISQDPAMSCKLLQIINSSFFGLPRRAQSPAHAARLLGLERLRPIVLSAGVFSQYSGTGLKGLTIEGIMKHSLATAACARALIELECPGQVEMAQDACLASILHDVGQLILMQNRGKDYGVLLEQARCEEVPLHEMEIRQFKVCHAALGSYLLKLWGLPDVISEAVAFHHTPRGTSCETFDVLAAVHVADALAHEHPSSNRHAWMAPLDELFIRQLGLEDRLSTWRGVADMAFQGVMS